MNEPTYDIAIVGYGPVGMALAALLGQAGHRVVVLERYAGKYNLPRAAIFDDETMRTFARIGIADVMLPKVHAQRSYDWRNAAGDILIEHDFAAIGRSGWSEWYMMYQPDLEDALDAVVQGLASVDVRFGAPVIGIEQSVDGVELAIDGASSVTAKYVVACDGGNSFVRRALKVTMDDYGFSEPWMVCDFRLNGPVAGLPMARQVCDPAQPISIISLGPKHHRFSFMLGPDDDPELASTADRVWDRVARYLQPNQAELIRAATYTFRSLVAQRWRDARIVLAGDAAHQMPPFLGQGMCSGVRDAINLSLKFDLILSGVQPDTILDTYQSERDVHVRAVTMKGIELGRVQTMRDPAAAAMRDEGLLARHRSRTKPEKIAFPALGDGLFGTGSAARELVVQGRLAREGLVDRFDAIIGYGPVVIVRGSVATYMSSDLIAEAAAVGIRTVLIDCTARGTGYYDVDQTYGTWLTERACDAVAVRPDFHVWGSASGTAGAEFLVRTFMDLTKTSITAAKIAA